MAFNNEFVADCLQFERAFCTAKCPFNLDVRDFIGKLQQGRFNIAYKTYQYAVGFPAIVTALCGEPCKEVCPMKNAGGAISLRMLETAALNHARRTEPDQYNMPAKEMSIAIIGAGMSGLACALRLTTKKYKVAIFEKTDRIGGHLHNLLSPEIFLDDIHRQFMFEEYTLHLNTEILSLSELPFDAIYVATGKDGNDFGMVSDKEGVFYGGSLTGADTMQAMAQGLNISAVIEGYLKTGMMSSAKEVSDTKLLPEGIRIIPREVIFPEDGKGFTKEEAVSEAKRCLKCSCDACVHFSPLMNYFSKFPKRITEEVEVTINPSSLDGNATLATRFISTCNHCGLCKEVCPVNIDMGEFLLRSHRTMHEKGKMPWAFHEFYLRDMEFSNTDAALSKIPDGFETSSYMFFPGCQLGASDPQYVTRSYEYLIRHFPDTALMLSCCGAPAEWAGDEAIHQKAIDKIKTDWVQLGKPKAIFACPMCKQMLDRYLPEIEGVFLYNLMKDMGLKSSYSSGERVSIFDPCASRNEPELQKAIRELALSAGFQHNPLPMEGKRAECCSYGGQVAITYPPYASHMVKNRIEQNEYPYITYCANCRDIFASAGKKTLHILDVLLEIDRKNHKPPTVSERRENRLRLKHQLLTELWNEKNIMEKLEKRLIISQELKEKLNKELILESDIYTVIEICEQSGNKLFDPDAKTYSGHSQIGNMTFWVEYMIKENSVYELVNAYCHRMKIEEE